MPSEDLPFWRRRVVYRGAIALYIAIVLALGAFAVSVNLVQVEGAAYLRAHPEVERGRTNGMRGIFQYSPTGEALYPETMEWSLRASDGDGPDETYPIEFVAPSALDAWPDLTFRIPDEVPDGTWTFHLETTHEKVSSLVGTAEVDISTRPDPPASLSDVDWPGLTPRADDADSRPSPVRHRSGPDDIAISVVPADGELLRSHEQNIYLRTYDRSTGEPVEAHVQFELRNTMVEGEFPSSVVTGPQGFAALSVTPITDVNLVATIEPLDSPASEPARATSDAEPDEVTPDEEPVTYRLYLSAVSVQLHLGLNSPVVAHGGDIEGAVRSILADGTYMVDLYDGHRLLDTLTLARRDGVGGVRFAAPRRSETSPLLRVQTYQSLYGVDHGWDAAYVLLVDEDTPQQRRRALGELWRWLGTNHDSPHYAYLAEDEDFLADLSNLEVHRLLEAGLADIPRTIEIPPVLINTRQADRAALEQWRQEMRTAILVMMVLLLFIGLVVVLYFIALGVRRHQTEAMAIREVELEFDDPDPAEQLRAQRIERLVVILQGVIVFSMLVAFAVGIVVVTSVL